MSTAAEFDAKYDIINGPPPRHVLMCGRYKQSFAYYTLRERLPVILTGIIDNLIKNKDDLAKEYGENSREEIKNVVGLISRLKYQLQTDKRLEVFTGHELDKMLWNTFINELPQEKNTFYKTCWLYAECYMYRKVYSFFESTETLLTYDYFFQQKKNALAISTEVLEGIAYNTRRLEKDDTTFIQLVKLNLWGNRCDLSITSGKEVRPTENQLQIINSWNSNLVIDQSAAIWDCIVNADNTKPIYIDFVCDNAGYELFTDLILADYIIEKGLANKVHFHIKALPWFISDVTLNDFHHTVQYLKNHSSQVLKDLGKKWLQYLKDGKFEIQSVEYFWTSPYEYYKMKEVNPDLYKKLVQSHLVIFKGDLNYRKLIGDFTWDFTEDFITCLRGFQPANLCTLRTVKADLICGLPAGMMEKLYKQDANWMVTGEYGVIQFSEKSQCDCAQKD